MSEREPITRRNMLSGLAAAAALAGVSVGEFQEIRAQAAEGGKPKLKGNLKQSVCKWCYSKISVDELAGAGAGMGIVGMDLIGPDDWGASFKHNVRPVMAYARSGPRQIEDGLNDKANHDRFEPEFHKNIDLAAEKGVPNIICFSGNRRGMPDDQGLENCAAFLKKVVTHAEEKNVMICMELLNSRVNHKDYMCDRTPWGVELVKRVNSPKFKLLYDIYHMQIMEGDVIRTIRDNIQHIAHFHTGGVPGRNEIDDTQELNYRTIAKAIVDTGFQGYFAHEFIPKREPLVSLREAVLLCDV